MRGLEEGGGKGRAREGVSKRVSMRGFGEGRKGRGGGGVAKRDSMRDLWVGWERGILEVGKWGGVMGKGALRSVVVGGEEDREEGSFGSRVVGEGGVIGEGCKGCGNVRGGGVRGAGVVRGEGGRGEGNELIF